MQKIKRVVGVESGREGEYPPAFWVGHGAYHPDHIVDHIEIVEENLGTYGIKWFVAYDGGGGKIGELNALHVSEVEYFPEEPDA